MDYKPANLWSRWVNVTGVRAELTLRHLVPPDAYRKHLPSGARAITLHDQDLDSTSTRLVRENPELLDYGVAVLSIVKTDSFTVQGRAYPGAYAVWWLYALDTTSAPKRILVRSTNGMSNRLRMAQCVQPEGRHPSQTSTLNHPRQEPGPCH